MAKKTSVEITGIRELELEVQTVLPKLSLIETSDIAVKMVKKNIEPFSDTGALEKSIKWKYKGTKDGKITSVITSNLPYANIQDQGGRIKITDRMRRKMWQLYYKTGDVMYKAIAITKKTFVTIKAYHYTKINKKVLERLAQVRIDKKTNKIKDL